MTEDSTNFFQKVYDLVKQIPYGRVATYGQIAALAGSPRAARQVGYALRALGTNEANVPWWRVVNKQGYLSINHGKGGEEKEIQRLNLEAEGVQFTADYYIKELNSYLW